MAVYKVPQDVEAEDKLIGPLGFRQFVYVMIAVGAAFVGFFLFQISPVLVAIPLPIILLFGALALPLRKDQPMETYMLAIIRFILKPKKRLWNPDGTITYVEVTAPRVVEQQLTKDLSQQAAEERLDYLARIMDSRGWASKGVNRSEAALSPAIINEAQSATDILDAQADLAKSFDNMLAKKTQQSREQTMQKIQQAFRPSAQRDTFAQVAPSAPVDGPQPSLRYNPYPTIHQKVVLPSGAKTSAPQQVQKEPKTNQGSMTAAVSPDIMRLANNNDLSISALAREAHRLQEGDEGEVVIALH